MENTNGGKCGCCHHKVIPILVILLGLEFLAYNLGWGISEGFLSLSWPVLVIAAGIMMLTKRMCKCCQK